MRAFLLVFDSSKISRDLVSRRIDKISEIGNWYALFDNTFCIASDQSASWLAARLREDVIPDVRFMVAEVQKGKKGGWLPKVIWEFLNQPEPAETSAA